MKFFLFLLAALTIFVGGVALFAQDCGGCGPYTVKDSDEQPVSVMQVASANSWSVVTAMALAPGVCGPGTGTTCTEQISPATLELRIESSVDPLEFVVVNAATVGVILPPSGYSLILDTLTPKCEHLSQSRALVYLFDAVTYEIIEQDWLVFGAKSCPLPD
jgi:hypothetical protein